MSMRKGKGDKSQRIDSRARTCWRCSSVMLPMSSIESDSPTLASPRWVRRVERYPSHSEKNLSRNSGLASRCLLNSALRQQGERAIVGAVGRCCQWTNGQRHRWRREQVEPT